MAKGQKRSNRELKKPRQTPKPASAGTPFGPARASEPGKKRHALHP